MSSLSVRPCAIEECTTPAQPGETFCDDHLAARFVMRVLEIDEYSLPRGCKHPAECKAKAHHPGGPIAPDFRHCEECRNG